MAFDDIWDMVGDISSDVPELIGTLTESSVLTEAQQKMLSLALKLTFGSIKIYREYQDKKSLETVGQDLDGQLPPELAEELREFCRQFQENGVVIPLKCRERFLKRFLEKRPDFQYTPQLYNAFSVCVNKLEEAVRTNYSVGELGIVRAILYATQVGDDTNRLARENNQLLKESNLLQMESNLLQKESNQLLKARDISATSLETLHTSNDLYAQMFTEPLFLHRSKNPKVNLSNLFVLPNASIDSDLAAFIQSAEMQFLFIEGNASWGKSSLTQYVSYHYKQKDATAQRIFGNTRLITVRLRDIEEIPTNRQSKDRLLYAVLHFLYHGSQQSDKDKLTGFQKIGSCLLWLDGYDELCTMEGIDNTPPVIEALRSMKCKIVITSRPHYLPLYGFRNYQHIGLHQFSPNQRHQWLWNYENRCEETLGKANQEYLKHLQKDDDVAGICDTPLGLYMVAAGRFPEDALDNEWALYRQIFHEEIKNTDYSETEGDTVGHPALEYWESLYQVSEEIAWFLYRNNTAGLLVSNQDVAAIIEKLSLKKDEDIIKRCFALCGYWNTDTKQGYVEFYHNNIRDFFLCEKFMRELNNAYEKYKSLLRDEKADIFPFLQRLCELFQYGRLEERVLRFLLQRSAYSIRSDAPLEEREKVCVQSEREHHNTIRIFERLLREGESYWVCNDQRKKENPVGIVARILYHVVSVYRHLYEPFLQKSEKIRWWQTAGKVNVEEAFQCLTKSFFHFAGPSDLCGVDLRGADLQGADLCDADLLKADLRDADLQKVDLQGANLQGAGLQGANLQNANLQGVNLQGANLQGADLRSARLQNANLCNLDLRSADLRGADLQGADLQGANLYDADLRGMKLQSAKLSAVGLQDADLRGVDLQGADLQGADLLRADLEGADLHNAKLYGAYLQIVNLRSADLRGADLQKANLSNAHLESTDLRGAKLQGANLRSANLQRANLSNAYLEGADLRFSKKEGCLMESIIGMPITD